MTGIACAYNHGSCPQHVYLNNVDHRGGVWRCSEVLRLGEQGPDEASMVCLQSPTCLALPWRNGLHSRGSMQQQVVLWSVLP